MNHAFTKSFIHPEQCGICKKDEISHGKNATCESCSAIGNIEWYPALNRPNAMVLCADCIAKEKSVTDTKIAAINSINSVKANQLSIPDNGKISYDINQKYSEHKTVIECRQEFYNFEARAIIELKAKIDADDEIKPDDKRKELARLVQANILTYQTALFEISEKQSEITNRLRANIVYFNGVIDNLRASEREELKLKDSTYIPVKSKPLNAASPTPKLSKIDKTIDNFAKFHKISFDDAKRRLGI